MPPQQGQRLSDLVGHRFDFGAHCSSSSQLGHPPALRRRGCSCLTLYRFGGVSYRPSPPCCHPRQASVSERDPGPLRRLVSGPSMVPGSRSRSEEHTSELQSLMRISYAVFCLKKKNNPDRQKERVHELTNRTTQ